MGRQNSASRPRPRQQSKQKMSQLKQEQPHRERAKNAPNRETVQALRVHLGRPLRGSRRQSSRHRVLPPELSGAPSLINKLLDVDLNKDRCPDIVVAAAQSTQVQIFFNAQSPLCEVRKP